MCSLCGEFYAVLQTLTAVREEVNDVATELREVEEDFHGQIAPLQPVKQQLSV